MPLTSLLFLLSPEKASAWVIGMLVFIEEIIRCVLLKSYMSCFPPVRRWSLEQASRSLLTIEYDEYH